MSDLAGWKVHGPVRTLRREVAEWDTAHDAWQAPQGVSICSFRPDGQASEGEFHNPDGSVARWTRAYDAGGRIIEAQSWMDEGPATSVFYSYDGRGRQTAAVEVAPDGTRREIETCRYDGAGRKTKLTNLARQHPAMTTHYGIEGTEHAYGAPGAVTLTVEYDERELPVEGSFHEASGAVVRRVVFLRDGEGRVLTEVAPFSGEIPLPDTLIDADIPIEERAAAAELLKAAFADQMFTHTAYAYDVKGRLLEMTVRIGTLSEERTTFQYDDYDNPIAEISEERARVMVIGGHDAAPAREEEPRAQHNRFDYTYDARGNWTERVVWIQTGSQPAFQRSNIERRTITYYEL
jgi:hypothetical protein